VEISNANPNVKNTGCTLELVFVLGVFPRERHRFWRDTLLTSTKLQLFYLLFYHYPGTTSKKTVKRKGWNERLVTLAVLRGRLGTFWFPPKKTKT